MKITSWSFSRYNDYKECPAKAKYKHIDRLTEPPNQAMARGTAIHALAESYIKGVGRNVPTELKLFAEEIKALRKIFKQSTDKITIEDNWAFTKDWARTTWDNWEDCWLRIKLDCAHFVSDDVLVITDWKTGKFREELHAQYLEQLELYALAALILYPKLKEVRPRLIYLDMGVTHPTEDKPLVFKRADLPKLKKAWLDRTKAMLNDTIFAPRPNSKCKWCYFSASKNGPCKF